MSGSVDTKTCIARILVEVLHHMELEGKHEEMIGPEASQVRSKFGNSGMHMPLSAFAFDGDRVTAMKRFCERVFSEADESRSKPE